MLKRRNKLLNKELKKIYYKFSSTNSHCILPVLNLYLKYFFRHLNKLHVHFYSLFTFNIKKLIFIFSLFLYVLLSFLLLSWWQKRGIFCILGHLPQIDTPLKVGIGNAELESGLFQHFPT